MSADPAPEQSIAKAFELGKPRAALTVVQHTSFETWRFETSRGRYLVKRLWTGDDPPWWPRIRDAMEFESLALAAGVVAAAPVPPVAPVFGCAARVDGFGTCRLYEWIDHRPLTESDDITEWLGTTLALLHTLKPLEAGATPEWRWWGVHPRQDWETWIAAGASRGMAWAAAAEKNLDFLLELTDRLRSAYDAAGDAVLAHDDLEPYNVLMTSAGPVLIDWESVACDSATLETGRTALSFGYGDPARVGRLLDCYRSAGGRLAPLGDELFLRKAALDLGHITERISAALGAASTPGWMRSEDIDRTAAEEIAGLPERVARLTLRAGTGPQAGRRTGQ